MSARIFRVIVQVSDIEKAALFYKNLLGTEGERISPGRHYFRLGEVILACFDPKADGDNFDPRPNPDHIYLATSELEEMYARAQKLPCVLLEPIEKRVWGEVSFYLKDLFGNPLCFVDETTALK